MDTNQIGDLINKLFDNPGKKLKFIAYVCFLLGLLGCAITALSFITGGEGWGILILLVGPVVLYIETLVFVGFAELIENSTIIARSSGPSSSTGGAPAAAVSSTGSVKTGTGFDNLPEL